MRLTKVLKKGQSLNDIVFWKKVQMLVTMLIGISPYMRIILPNGWIQDDTLLALDSALAAVVVYLTPATTDKLGI